MASVSNRVQLPAPVPPNKPKKKNLFKLVKNGGLFSKLKSTKTFDDDSHIYVNNKKKVELYDLEKAKGGEDQQTWQRIKKIIDIHYPDLFTYQDLNKTVFSVIFDKTYIENIPTYSYIKEINRYFNTFY